MNSFLPLLLCCAVAQAQTFFDPYISPIGQWTPKGVIYSYTSDPIRILNKQSVREITPPKMHNPFEKTDMAESFPNGLGGKSFYWEGRLYSNGWDGSRSVLLVRDGASWKEDAAVSAPDSKRRAHLVPLKNGRYLVFNPRDSELKPDQPSPWFYGIYARDDHGTLAPRNLETLSRDWFKDKNLSRVVRDLTCSALTDDHLVLCCPEYGVFWIFSLEDGRLQRTVDLYGGKAEKLLKSRDVPRMITQFQPQKDGTLLISARDEAILDQLPALVRKYEASVGSTLSATLSDDQIINGWRFADQQLKELLMQIPYQRWFELDPANGSLHRRNPPPVGAQDLLPPLNPEEASKTFWIVDAEGRVTYTASDFSAFRRMDEPKPASAKGKTTPR